MSHLPPEEDKARAVRTMFDRIAPRYDLVNRVMTFRMDVGWRRRSVDSLGLCSGDLVADVACGTGDFCREVERRRARAVGFDVSIGMLRNARTGAALVQADGLALPLKDACIDGITCGFALRNVISIPRLLSEFARVLKPDGRVAILEVSEPSSRLLRAGHRFYFRKIVPVIGSVLSDRQAYRYLPESTSYLPPTDALLDMMVLAGFTGVDAKRLGPGVAQLLVGRR